MEFTEGNDEFDLLLAELLDGTAPDEAWGRVNEFLQDDPGLQDYYLTFIAVHSELLWKHESALVPEAASLANSTEAEPEETIPMGGIAAKAQATLRWASRRPTPSSMTIATVVVSLLIVVMYLMVVPPRGSAIHTPGNPKPGLVVAQLTGLHEVVWAKGQVAMDEDVFLQQGQQIVLQKGLVEVTFKRNDATASPAQSTTIILEGPCEFTVDSNNSGSLNVGTLTATATKGFTIRSPLVNVMDLGTQFGVVVAVDDTTHVQVTRGSVRLDSTKSSDSLVLRAGEACGISMGTGLTKTAPRKQMVQRFPHTLQVVVPAVESVHLRGPSPPAGYQGNQWEADDLLLGSLPPHDLMRPACQFDLSNVPEGAKIVSASLVLFSRRPDEPLGSSQNKNVTVDLHPLEFDVDPRSATWDEKSSGTPWSVPGGTLSSTLLSSSIVNPATAVTGTRFVFSSSTSFRSVVQESLSKKQRLALLVKLRDESPSGRQIFRFGRHNDVYDSRRPFLVVHYSLPVHHNE